MGKGFDFNYWVSKMEEKLDISWAKYGQFYIEDRRSLAIHFKNGEVKDISDSVTRGWNLKVFKDGRWSFFASDIFSEKELDRGLRESKELLESLPKREGDIFLLDPLKAEFIYSGEVPYTLGDRIETLKRYDEIIRRESEREGINLTREIYWREEILLRAVITTEGRTLKERRLSHSILFEVGGDLSGRVEHQYSHEGFTNSPLAPLNLEKASRNLAVRVLGNLKSGPIKTGRYDIIVDPYLAGVFIHEAFGHLSEADFHEDDPKLRELFYLGREVGPKDLDVIETGRRWGLRGYLPFDDEGVISEDVYLIRNGVISGFLHSRESAKKFGPDFRPTGNSRLESYQKNTLVRMRTTTIQPSRYTREDLFKMLDNGIYLKGSRGGTTKFDEFTFSAAEAFLIKDGRVVDRYRDAMLKGNIFETLRSIEAIANDLKYFSGTCGKLGNSVPVSAGSPHLLIRNVLITGA